MKKALFGLLGLAIAVYVVFVVLKPTAIAPNGELSGSPSASVKPQAQIIVTEPKINAIVKNPIIVMGKAIAFESTVNWRLRNDTGVVLSQGSAMTNAPDVGQYGDFLINIAIPKNASKALTVEVYEASAKDGSDLHKVTIQVRTN